MESVSVTHVSYTSGAHNYPHLTTVTWRSPANAPAGAGLRENMSSTYVGGGGGREGGGKPGRQRENQIRGTDVSAGAGLWESMRGEGLGCRV